MCGDAEQKAVQQIGGHPSRVHAVCLCDGEGWATGKESVSVPRKHRLRKTKTVLAKSKPPSGATALLSMWNVEDQLQSSL